MKRFVVLPIVAGLVWAAPAQAVGLFGGGKPVMVQEDYVFLTRDATTKQVHVLFSARVEPAFRRVQIGFPTPTTPTLEHVVVDLPEVLHKLIAPHEMRARRHPPAPPAPWITSGARVDTYVISAGSADQTFDAAWTQSYVGKGYFIATTGVVTPEDGRIEVFSPTMHISFTAERLTLPRREPPLPRKGADIPAALPDKPRLPVEVTVTKVEPRQKGLSGETLGRILNDRPADLLTCYERLLEKKPNLALTLALESTVRPKGDIVAFKMLDGATEPVTKELSACVTKVLQNKQLVKANEGYAIQLRIAFTPPRLPARRTHILAIGPSKYVWRNLPSSVRLDHDFEILPLDLQLALGADIRKVLGFREGERVWVSHWLDQNVRRAEAEDIEFEEQALPALGEPGALPPLVHDADLDRPKPSANVPSRQTISRKQKHVGALLGVLLVGMLAALGTALFDTRSTLRS